MKTSPPKKIMQGEPEEPPSSLHQLTTPLNTIDQSPAARQMFLILQRGQQMGQQRFPIYTVRRIELFQAYTRRDEQAFLHALHAYLIDAGRGLMHVPVGRQADALYDALVQDIATYGLVPVAQYLLKHG